MSYVKRRKHAIARHEISHAVVAVALGLHVGEIAISITGGHTDVEAEPLAHLVQYGTPEEIITTLAHLLAPAVLDGGEPFGDDKAMVAAILHGVEPRLSARHLEHAARDLAADCLRG